MKTYVALLRGVNVGGKNILPMKEFKARLAEAGARDVRTYIQSGNAVFRSAQRSPARIAERLAAAISSLHGFTPQVLVLEVVELVAAMERNPFPEAEADPRSLHLGFLAATPVRPDLIRLDDLKRPSERYRLADRVFYLHAPEGVGRSRLAAGVERILGVPVTDRNWRTVVKLRELAGA